MNICFIGPEGSGKGTQADLLSQKLGIPHIVTGEILAKLMEEDTPLGAKIREVRSTGKYLPDEDMVPIVFKRLEDPDCANGFIMDGFPRNGRQAEILEEALNKKGQKIEYAFVITLPREKSVERLLKRGRFDDSPEKIEGRLNSYYEREKGMVDFYTKQGTIQTINGDDTIENIQQDIVSRIQPHE